METANTVSASKITLSELMLPSHSNFSGKIHGGYLLRLMDQIAFACASKYSGSYCVTASVDTVDFLNPVEIGELVTLKASVNYVGKTSMVVGIRVTSEHIQTGVKKVIFKHDYIDNTNLADRKEFMKFIEVQIYE